MDTLADIRDLPDDWNLEGAAKPNATSVQNTTRVLRFVRHTPASVLPSVEEGVLVRFGARSEGAYIECYNDGEIACILVKDGKVVKNMDVSELSLESVLCDVNAHLDAT